MIPGVFFEAVFEGDDRVILAPGFEESDEGRGVHGALFGREIVFAAREEVGSGDVDRNRDLFAGDEAGVFDGAGEDFESFFVGFETRTPASFVGDAGEIGTSPFEHLACGAVDGGDPFHRLREALGGPGDGEEILKLHGPAGVQATTEDVDHGKRKCRSAGSGKVTP